MLIAAAALFSLIAFHWIPAWIPFLLRTTHKTFAGLIVTQFAAAVLTVFPAAVLFGFNFPLVIALITRGAAQPLACRPVGDAYAANTVGAIVGSIATGLWLLPRFGSFQLIAGVAALNVVLALAIHFSVARRRLLPVAICAALLASVFLVARSPFLDDQALLTLSAVLYGNSYQGRLTLSEIAATKDLVYAADGVNESVAVVRTDGDVALRLNGKVDASTQDASTQLLLGHLGAAFHPSPHRVLIVGFGSGMTASAVARYPDVEKIDAVEIEPVVLRAAPYLATLSRGVLKDPRLHIISDDARDFLLTSREKYDLIISEPSNPWISGVATLFTDEFYAAARERLRSGGIFVQWVQAYSLAPADLRIVAGTFKRHFADVTLWRAGQTDLLLLGRMDKSPLSFDRLRSFWGDAALREDYASLKVHEPEGLAAYFLLDDAGMRQLAHGSALNTDDRTVLEYDAPRSLLASESIDADQNLITQFRTEPLPGSLAAAERQPALVAGLNTALDLDDASNARLFLNAFERKIDDCFLYIAKGRLALLQNAIPLAKALLHKAVVLEPESPEAGYWLAIAQQRSGDNAAALAAVEATLASHPKFLPALEEQMELADAQRDFRKALSAQLKRMALLPDAPAYEYGRLGALWLDVSNISEAKSALLKGLAKDPYCYACHFELGELFTRSNQLPLARRQFEWVVRFFPDSGPPVFTSLVVIDYSLKDTKSARSVLNEGLRLYPDDTALLAAQKAIGS
jgi:spermidine synthase/tetratricopeptide (TPR) repeat protein